MVLCHLWFVNETSACIVYDAEAFYIGKQCRLSSKHCVWCLHPCCHMYRNWSSTASKWQDLLEQRCLVSIVTAREFIWRNDNPRGFIWRERGAYFYFRNVTGASTNMQCRMYRFHAIPFFLFQKRTKIQMAKWRFICFVLFICFTNSFRRSSSVFQLQNTNSFGEMKIQGLIWRERKEYKYHWC